MTAEQAGDATSEHSRSLGAPREAVAPSKPAAPRAHRAEPRPEPIEIDVDDDLTAPNPGPPAHEVLPEPRSPFEAASHDAAPATPTAPLRPFDRLGAAAATNAALSAAGAPTPLGGVPRVASGDASDLAAARLVDLALEDDAPAFVPTFATARPAAEAPTIARLPSGDAPLYRPRVVPTAFAPVMGGTDDAPAAPPAASPSRRATAASSSPPDEPTSQAAGGDSGSGGRGEGPVPGRRPGRAWPLIVIGLLILGGIATALWWGVLRPEAITLPEQRVIEAPAGTAVEPITPENPTAFLAALPTTAGTWALVAVVTNDPLLDDALPGRVAEHHTLTYSDGVSEVTLEARQLYHAADAHDALVREAGPDAELAEAVVAGTVVGERAERTGDGQTRVMWTHDAAYFEAAGPSDAVLALVAALGL